LAVDASSRDAALVEEVLSHPDVLLSLVRHLRREWDTNARMAADEAIMAHKWIESSSFVGLFDERDFFLGELALIAATGKRHLGDLDEAEMWLDRAQASFTNIVNPAPSIAGVAYARLTIQYDRARYEHVLATGPSLVQAFERLDMARESAKCRLVLAAAHKMLGNRSESLQLFEGLGSQQWGAGDNDLRSLALVHLGEMLLSEGQTGRAAEVLSQARGLIDQSRASIALAHLQAMIGEALSAEGRLADASKSYRASAATYRELGISGWEAYIRLALAANLLKAGEGRQAEWEVLAALPAIDAQRLEPHARVAVALLASSVQARKTDEAALAQVRSCLKSVN
jgi:hypothetical protein